MCGCGCVTDSLSRHLYCLFKDIVYSNLGPIQNYSGKLLTIAWSKRSPCSPMMHAIDRPHVHHPLQLPITQHSFPLACTWCSCRTCKPSTNTQTNVTLGLIQHLSNRGNLKHVWILPWWRTQHNRLQRMYTRQMITWRSPHLQQHKHNERRNSTWQIYRSKHSSQMLYRHKTLSTLLSVDVTRPQKAGP